MKSSIICIGTELNLGLIVNTNAKYISEKLAEIGIDCNLILTIKDEKEDISDSLKYALERSDIVIISGGLGPTDDDITREAVADALNLRLYKDDKLDVASLKFIKPVLTNELKTRLLRQSFIPEGSIPILPNIGSASGFIIEIKERKKWIFVIPGVPKEMKDMFDKDVLPKIMKLYKQQTQNELSKKIKKKVLLTTGISESEIEENIKDIYKEAKDIGVKIGITASPGLIRLIIISESNSNEKNEKNIKFITKKLMEKLGNYIYGEEEDLIANNIKNIILNSGKNITISVAESLTGGLISNMISDIPGSSEYFLGGVVSYSNYSKIKLLNIDPIDLEKYGAVSSEVCKKMAISAKRLFNSDFAISATGFAGPTVNEAGKDVGLVYTCIAGPGDNIKIFENKFIGTRTEIKFRVSQFILNKLRIEIEEYNKNSSN